MLELQNFGIKIGQTTILHPFNLTLRVGQCIGILGANGSGKSTLLKAIGQNIAYQGNLFFQQQNLANYSIPQRANLLAFMPQHSSLNFAFSVVEIVQMGVMMYQLAPDIEQSLINQAMQAFDITKLAYCDYLKLSGGEKQRVHAARTWVQVLGSDTTKIIMLDEPTSALDLKYQHQLLQQTKLLANQHLVLIVLHDLNLASRYCDHLLLLEKGRFFAFGETKQVLTAENIRYLYDYPAEVYSYQEQLCVW